MAACAWQESCTDVHAMAERACCADATVRGLNSRASNMRAKIIAWILRITRVQRTRAAAQLVRDLSKFLRFALIAESDAGVVASRLATERDGSTS